MTALSVQIRHDTREVERLLSGLGRDANKVITRALNRTLSSVNTVATRAIAKDMGVAQKVIKPSLYTRRASFHNRRAELVATGRRIPLIAFRAKETKTRGVTYAGQDGRRQSIQSAFFATMESGHKGVFKRQGAKRTMKRGRYAGKLRQPIVELHGPSVPYVMLQRRVQAAMDGVAREKWVQNVQHELRYYLRYARG